MRNIRPVGEYMNTALAGGWRYSRVVLQYVLLFLSSFPAGMGDIAVGILYACRLLLKPPVRGGAKCLSLHFCGWGWR